MSEPTTDRTLSDAVRTCLEQDPPTIEQQIHAVEASSRDEFEEGCSFAESCARHAAAADSLRAYAALTARDEKLEAEAIDLRTQFATWYGRAFAAAEQLADCRAALERERTAKAKETPPPVAGPQE